MSHQIAMTRSRQLKARVGGSQPRRNPSKSPSTRTHPIVSWWLRRVRATVICAREQREDPRPNTAHAFSHHDGLGLMRGTILKKGITLIGVLVVMLAVTSGAFAAHRYLITSSSQIKDGAVSLSDLSPAARQALLGQKGATSAAGPQGPAGARGRRCVDRRVRRRVARDRRGRRGRGPQGPVGVSGYGGSRTWRVARRTTSELRTARPGLRRCRTRVRESRRLSRVRRSRRSPSAAARALDSGSTPRVTMGSTRRRSPTGPV